MSNYDLFGKTFDQQLQKTSGDIEGEDISPNRQLKSEIIFEPTGTEGVRITARDENHKVLWGYVASKETLDQDHCLVAQYTILQELIDDEVQKSRRITKRQKAHPDPVPLAKQALDEIDNTIQSLRDSLDVKKVTNATKQRAIEIARIAKDAQKQIWLEASSLKGMKSKD